MRRFGLVFGFVVVLSVVGLATGCDETHFNKVRNQVDTFEQKGDQVVDVFTQAGTQKVDTFVQTGFRQVDAFQQKAAAQVDILWVVDNSASMAQEQANLGTNFNRFIAFIDQSLIEYHIGVISTDMDDAAHQGKLLGNPKVIVRNANAAAQFQANVQVGTAGGGNEKGLFAAHQALAEPLLSGANANFLRPDASLAVIFVSDENDKSAGGIGYYTRYFAELKGPGNERNVILGALVGDSPEGCSGATGTAEFGERYHLIVDALGGTKGSICASDFGPTLEQLGLTVAGLTRKYTLSKTPDPTTVVVRVKERGAADFTVIPEDSGVPGQPNWRLRLEEPAIYFDSAYVPGPEAEIQVEYGNVERNFRLSGTGDPTTLKVTVDEDGDGPGAAVEMTVNVDWWYDSDNNSVVFTGDYVPPLGAVIEVSYSDLMRAFALSRTVENPDTLVVEIDLKQGAGFQTVLEDPANGWMYDSRSNSVLFQGGYIPPLGADLRVSYSNLEWVFPLSKTPVVSTLVVELDSDGASPQEPAFVPEDDPANGVAGWVYYDPDAAVYPNSISFENLAWPPLGSLVIVTYAPAGE